MAHLMPNYCARLWYYTDQFGRVWLYRGTLCIGEVKQEVPHETAKTT